MADEAMLLAAWPALLAARAARQKRLPPAWYLARTDSRAEAEGLAYRG